MRDLEPEAPIETMKLKILFYIKPISFEILGYTAMITDRLLLYVFLFIDKS